MKVATIITVLGAAVSSIATSVSYDTGYDQSSRSMNVVACSDGANGLETKYGYKTQGQIPSFPNIGGSSTIAGWNSAQCGTCMKVTYNGKSIFVTAMDHAGNGLNLSLAAMNKLTNNQAQQLGRVEATVKQVSVSKCGLTAKRDLKAIEFEA